MGQFNGLWDAISSIGTHSASFHSASSMLDMDYHRQAQSAMRDAQLQAQWDCLAQQQAPQGYIPAAGARAAYYRLTQRGLAEPVRETVPLRGMAKSPNFNWLKGRVDEMRGMGRRALA